MAYLTDNRTTHLPLFSNWREALRSRRAQNRVFRQTYSELNGLNDRELADIGIHRTMIRSIAKEAAYGK